MAKGPVEHLQTQIPSFAVDFDVEAFDNLIRTQGVRLVHYRALRCPVGMTDIGDNRRPHEDHAGCSNGFIYNKAGVVTASLLGNGNELRGTDVGFVDGASATATFPVEYDQSCTSETGVYVAPFDRFYLDEEAIVVPTWQLVKASDTGLDRLQFPAVQVDYMLDNRGKQYECGIDFTLKNGMIVWQPGHAPAADPESGNPAVISIRYRYRPYWYVARMLHEIRVSQLGNPITGERKLVRMQQQVMLNREYLYLNEQNDPNVDGTAVRQAAAPADGGFGAR